MKDLSKQVDYFLENVPDSRNSDRALVVLIYRRYLGTNSMDVSDLMRLPTHESIKRLRAKRQENGQRLPTDPTVAEKRRRQTAIVKDVLGI